MRPALSCAALFVKDTTMAFPRLAIFFVASSTLFAVSCASTGDQVSCSQRDWYELGRRDGAEGATVDRLSQYRKECRSGLEAPWETLYTNGRNAGLVEYCDAENAFELGRMGIPYFYVCPSTMEPEFVSGYRRGQQARQLELQKQELDAQIDTLNQKAMISDSAYERRKIRTELEQLRKRRTQANRDLSSFTK